MPPHNPFNSERSIPQLFLWHFLDHCHSWSSVRGIVNFLGIFYDQADRKGWWQPPQQAPVGSRDPQKSNPETKYAYLGAPNTVKWGNPEKILQNAVQTRCS